MCHFHEGLSVQRAPTFSIFIHTSYVYETIYNYDINNVENNDGSNKNWYINLIIIALNEIYQKKTTMKHVIFENVMCEWHEWCVADILFEYVDDRLICYVISYTCTYHMTLAYASTIVRKTVNPSICHIPRTCVAL